jgi:transposase
MKAYSMDLRERIVAARRLGESVADVAERFGVCTKTVRAYEKRAAQGRLAPTPQTGKARRLSDQEHEALWALVQERSDWTLASLARSWQERTPPGKQDAQELPSSTLHDALKRLGLTYKKRVASPQNAAPKNALRFARP